MEFEQKVFIFFLNEKLLKSMRGTILVKLFVKTALVKYFEDTAALGKYFEALPFSNFQKQIVSGSKLKCPSKVSWGIPTFSLLQCNLWQLFGKCSDRDGKMWKNV